MNRRDALKLLAAAPVAALLPPAIVSGFDAGEDLGTAVVIAEAGPTNTPVEVSSAEELHAMFRSEAYTHKLVITESPRSFAADPDRIMAAFVRGLDSRA